MNCLVFFNPSSGSFEFKIFPTVTYRDIDVFGRGIFRVIEYPKEMGRLSLYVYLRRAANLLKDAYVFNGSAFGFERQIPYAGGEELCARNLEGIMNVRRRGKEDNAGIIVMISSISQLCMIEGLINQTQKITVFAPDEILEEAGEAMLELFGIAAGARAAGTVCAPGKTVILLPGVEPPQIKSAGFVINLSGQRIKTRCATPKSIYLKPPDMLSEVCKYTGSAAGTIKTLMDFFGIHETKTQVISVKIDKQE